MVARALLDKHYFCSYSCKIFALPVAILIMAYAAVFPQEIQPLIPALQSYWLKIHVTTATLGEAFFAIGFAAGLMHLLRTVNFRSKDKKDRREQRGVEFTIFIVVMVAAFVGSIFSFNAAGYKAHFESEIVLKDPKTKIERTVVQKELYVLPPIVKPYQSETIDMMPFLGMKEPLFEAPKWLEGSSAGRKLNTVIWTVILGTLLYGLLRLVIRKPLGEAISPVLDGVDEEDLDEVAYRTIAIGYPIFTLGALIFAMIWAHGGMGTFLGLGSKGSMGTHCLAVLRSLLTFEIISRLARETLFMDGRYWLSDRHVYFDRG